MGRYIQLKQNGSMLIAIIIILPVFILIMTAFMQLNVSSYRVAKKDSLQTHAQFGADAAIDFALQEINEDGTWTGTVSPVEIHNDGNVRATYEAAITDSDSNNKVLTVTGRTYSPITHTAPDATVKLTVNLRAVKSGNYSIVTGVGGLFMSNTAKIVGGDVLVNGEIELKNTAQIGLTTNSVNVDVAHQTCPNPANATYPRICNPGENGEPIEIENSAHIYGSVKANNQTTTTGIINPGLIASSGVPAQSLPPYDRNAQKAAVVTTITGASASGSGSQTRTWTAKTKITGDVTISNNCVVTVLGNVWITGSLEAKNLTKINVSDTLGATQPIIMIDGAYAKFSNSSQLKSNANDTGFQIITYKSNASCSPECTSLTGTDLYNSRNLTTIELNNSASGPDSIFYARWSRVTINNSGQIGAIVGQTIELKNSGTITFGTSVPGTGTTTWVINGYRRSFN